MHDDHIRTEARIKKALDQRMRPRVWAKRQACEISSFFSGDPIAVSQALEASYLPTDPGTSWGPPWSTTWFRISGKIPAEWADRNVEVHVDLGFTDRSPGFQAEGLAFGADGIPIKGISPRNYWLPVNGAARSSGLWTCFVEAVAMPAIMGSPDDRFHPTELGDMATSGSKPLYTLGAAELVVIDSEAWALAADVEVLLGVLEQLAVNDARRHEILRALERCLDRYDIDPDPAAARELIAAVMAAPAARSAHHIAAVGHAHIDSAWLWPIRETVRKCARTFSNVAALGEQYPELVFACSQAQQWWWTKESYPAIFERMKDQVRRGQVVPVGGMWVESDTNVTGAEALVRQLVMGKRFFLSELGVETEEVWLPDCFGYSAALPQLILLSGSRWFLTQKISWNDTNKFPHHTFWWEGIDGSRVFTHFPPVDTYNSRLEPAELAHAAENYAERGFGTTSLVPFGFGDGGGGPTREMMERARRMADLDGAPKVKIQAPSEFFAAALAEYPSAPVWSGELYLELHRGTITSQVEIKQGNRRCEHLIRQAELWSTAAMVAGLAEYPYQELEEIWRDILLNQFHDILPGSSIAMVNDEAIASFAHCAARLETLIEAATAALCGRGDLEVAFNSAPHALGGVPALGAAPLPAASASAKAAGLVLENEFTRVTLNDDGHVVSLVDLVSGRQVVPPGMVANVLQLHPDIPNKWPAWDIDGFYRNVRSDIGSPRRITVVSPGPQLAAIEVEYLFGSSRAVQTLSLTADSPALVVDLEVDWREHDRLLKVALPVDVHAESSVAEIQFGHVRRPTHNNTSWDAARFEIVAHRFIHIAEAGYGVAVVNDGIYGHEVVTVARDGGGKATLARLSILRSPGFPDPRGENGVHRFHYAVVPGASLGDAVRHGYHFNLPLRKAMAERPLQALLSLGNDAVVVEAVKAADDRSGDVVVRLYESLGGRATSSVRASFQIAGAALTDLLERQLAEVAIEPGNQVTVELRPFQVLTLRLSPRR